jgi:hypothetical protein
MKTYEEIEAEWKQLVAQSSGTFPPEWKAIMTAFMQHSAGLVVTVRCIHCNGLLNVTGLAHGSAWKVNCPCGKSKDTLKGL